MSVALVPKLDLILVDRRLAAAAVRGMYEARDAEGSVGRFALDQWRNRMFLNVSQPANVNRQRTQMTRAQADELIDWAVWRQHTRAGAPAEAAAEAARVAARPQLVQLARDGHPCFRDLCPAGERCRTRRPRALNWNTYPEELRPPQQWRHLSDWRRRVAPSRWTDAGWLNEKVRAEQRREGGG